jgi:hypothetical protein
MAMKIGRNDKCHCGSGKKYKQCHAQLDVAQQSAWSKRAAFGIGAALLLGAGGFVYSIVTSTPTVNSAGRVWSEEHGHWHNADGTELGSAPRPATPVATPPPGPAPAGKVWSSEHGHWHDAETGGH